VLGFMVALALGDILGNGDHFNGGQLGRDIRSPQVPNDIAAPEYVKIFDYPGNPQDGLTAPHESLSLRREVFSELRWKFSGDAWSPHCIVPIALRNAGNRGYDISPQYVSTSLRTSDVGRRLAGILKHAHSARLSRFVEVEQPSSLQCDVGSKLALCGIASNSIGLKRKPKRTQDQESAYTTDPDRPARPISGLGRSIRGLPLGAQVAVSFLIAGIALGFIYRALMPFGRLVFRRGDIYAGVAYGLGGLGLLGLSGWVWSLGQ
jgi:hypothetical protein